MERFYRWDPRLRAERGLAAVLHLIPDLLNSLSAHEWIGTRRQGRSNGVVIRIAKHSLLSASHRRLCHDEPTTRATAGHCTVIARWPSAQQDNTGATVATPMP